MGPPVIRVLLVHETPLLRSALAAALGADPELGVEAVSRAEALEGDRTARADVCVADTDSPDRHTADHHAPDRHVLDAELGRRLRAGSTALLVLADTGRPGVLRRATEAGALGYVSKDADPERLIKAIRMTAEGHRYVDEALAPDFIHAATIPLTPRELHVLSLIADGCSPAEIASHLHLSRGTVRNYVAAVTRKTGARNRVDAVRISRESGWI
ncbi:response regulator transcription factor [Streptomyces sp. ST2-7A]|nr:response regulator transcription factor [Streptomyces sp. ST2-7A]